MFYRHIDKIFNQLKNLVSLISFLFIAFATYFFVYWLLFNAHVPVPQLLTALTWNIIDSFTFFVKHLPMYKDLIPVLPILTCAIFIILTYLLNSLIDFLEANRNFFKKQVDNKRIKLEKKINTELHKDFLDELKTYKHMLVKMKVMAVKQESYLSAYDEQQFDTTELASRLNQGIYNVVSSPFITSKKLEDNCVSFLVDDFEHSKDFISELVGKSVSIINKELRPKLDISFYCCAELFHEMSEYNNVSVYSDRILDLKIKNRISVTPKFKVYFENILPNEYHFDLTGEYNLSDNPDIVKNVMLHSIRRK